MRNYISNRKKRYADIPANLGAQRCQDKLNDLLLNPKTHKIKTEYNHANVREKLLIHFSNKCVYCEGNPAATSTFCVDHFRPKKERKTDDVHSGYYWLGYEWTNLIQSCQLCNQTKFNQFPLSNPSSRVTALTHMALDSTKRRPDTVPLSNEQRLLLHPELDDVEEHFYFNASGEIFSDTAMGKKSIEVYGLNRKDLIGSRMKKNDKIIYEIKNEMANYEEDYKLDAVGAKQRFIRSIGQKLTQILLIYYRNMEFSLFHYYIFDKFKEFVVDQFAIKEHKDLLTEAYATYLQKSDPNVI